MGETCRELSLGGFLIHLVTSFQDAFYIAGFTREGLANMPYEQISIQPSILFSWFSPTHGILWKIYLNGVWWRVQISYSCLIISWRISHPHLDCFQLMTSQSFQSQSVLGWMQARIQRGEGGGLPCPFSKIGKNCLNLWKKCPDCGHLWLKFFF